MGFKWKFNGASFFSENAHRAFVGCLKSLRTSLDINHEHHIAFPPKNMMKTNLSATCLRCLCLPTFHPPPSTVSTSSWNNCASCICVRSRQSVASLLVLLSRWSGEKIDIQGNLWVYSLRCCDGDGSYSLCHSEKTVLSSHKFQENVFSFSKSFSALFDCLLSSLVAPSTTEKFCLHFSIATFYSHS